jgi:asparagine synthase (glutamine-hydrolysing)
MFALSVAQPGGVSAHDVTAMANTLRGGSRKPAVWCDEQGRAGVGATVSGILPEDAFDKQPLVSPELVFVAQARIDNRDEILEELAVPPAQWATLADSEVLHSAYRRWEEDCVQRVYGDYAFAAWHRDSGKVVAAVDHNASVRLYYTQCDGSKLMLATQLGALLAHPQIPRDLNLKALGLLAAPKIEAGSTPFQHIRVLPGGHLLRYRQRTLEIRRWWQPDPTVRKSYRDPRDYVHAAQQAFEQAVRVRLRTVGPVAALMSGGLDSTLVAATAAQQLKECGQTMTAYLSVPEPGLACETRTGWEVDDSPYAEDVARLHDNLRLVKITPGRNGTLEIVPGTHASSRTPVRNGANQIWLLKACLASQAAGVRVMLNGGKGNATISQSGDGFLRDLILRLKWGEVIRQANARAKTAGENAWRAIAREMLGDKGRRALQLLGLLPKQPKRFGAALFTAEFRAAHTASLETFAQPLSTRQGQVNFMMGPSKQWAADAMAQWGIEMRDPTGDRRLIECLLGFPLAAFSLAGWPRGLAREMGRDRIPDTVRLRRTRGEQVPEFASLVALNAAGYRAALETAQGSASFRSIFDMERVHDLLERVCDGPAKQLAAHTIDRVADVGLFIAGAGN